ncbi:PAS domain S-box protein [Candidatus Nitronereus thalassa]|uniref:histidine kinase n=1 Tax=Candidatus Nitronereus thalassa TaxID=3020898 RepID=A0ABU3K8S0_9BACT|nr:PAS domain S-box protein [Candidatus Nitronereus thalassa]MDT7042757.1 PAS domain S-box protein [Candidatus Nitronereus thalassa]
MGTVHNNQEQTIEFLQARIAELEEKLKETSAPSEEGMRSAQFAMDRASDGIYCMGPDAKFIYVNDSACHSLGYSREEMLSLSVHDINPDCPADTWPDTWEKVKKDGIFFFDSHHRTKHGHVFPVEIRINYLKFDEREFNCAIVRDISERNRGQEKLRQSQALVHAIVENIPNMVFVKDAKDLRFVLLNKAGEDLLGYQRHELIGRTDYDLFPQKEADFFAVKDREVLEGCRLVEIPREQIHTRDKGSRLLHTKKVPILDSQGNPEYLLGISHDITEPQKAELQKAEKEMLLTTMLKTGPGCLKRVAADGTLLSMNPAGLEFIEADSENEAVGLSVFDLVLPEYRHVFKQMHQRVIEGDPQTLQFKIQGLKGTQCWMETYATPFKNPLTGQIEHLAVTHDITKRKAIENNLQVSERSIRQLYEITSSKNLSFDQKIRGLLILGCQRFGLPYGTLTKRVGKHLELEFLHAPDKCWVEHALVPICESFCGLALERETPLVFENAGKSAWATHPAYQAMGLEAYIGTRVTVGETMYGTLCFLDRVPYPQEFTAADQDFSQLMARWIGAELERKQWEQALQESEQRFRMVCEAIPQQVWTARPDGSLDYVNRRVVEYFELPFEQLIEQGWQNVIHPDDLPLCLERWAHARQTNQPYETEFRLKRGHDDDYRSHIGRALAMFNSQGEVIKWFGTNTDITDLKRMEAQLRQGQKMEAIGTLAGGIAHDFNNVLGVILGYAELAKNKASGNEALEKNLQEILFAGKRAKDLVQHILVFSRQEELVRKPIHLNVLLPEVLTMVRATLPATIEIHQKIQEDIAPILGDPTQLHQIILNLCSNAQYAMREEGGLLEIGVENLNIERPQRFDLFTLTPGNYVRLWVKDTGQGIAPELLNRIFDPFFTTKRIGEGTGMGLSVVLGIVTAHHGVISVESALGQGATFSIYFPEGELKSNSEIIPDLQETSLKKKAQILFVDDEIALARIGKEVLEALGCDVDICTNGEEALARVRSDLTHYDAVISDQTMPGMTGEKLAQLLLSLKSDLPIILCTGFSHSVTFEKAQQIGLRAFLKKPVLKEDLIQTLNKIL